jgi:hypothetical protein
MSVGPMAASRGSYPWECLEKPSPSKGLLRSRYMQMYHTEGAAEQELWGLDACCRPRSLGWLGNSSKQVGRRD